MPGLVGLIVREAGKTLSSAVAEVREAVDFLRYYGAQVRDHYPAGSHTPLGIVACISPWNFPLSIFTGQVAAALAAGNAVLAKPAQETPLIAAQAVAILHEAGVPAGAAQLLPGDGEVGARLVADQRVQGVMFTGSTDVARLIQRQLAGRLTADGSPVPLIAETGGQNALVVQFLGAGRTGGDRCGYFCVRQCRSALLGASCAVPAGGRGGSGPGDAEGRAGGTQGRQPGQAGDRCGPGYFTWGARPDSRACRGDARARPGGASMRGVARGCAWDVRAANDHRDRKPVGA